MESTDACKHTHTHQSTQKLTHMHIHVHTYTVLKTNKLITTTLTVVPESVSTTKHQITGWMHFTAHATSHPLSKKTQKSQNSTIGLMASWVFAKNSYFSICLSISFHLYSSLSLAVFSLMCANTHKHNSVCIQLCWLTSWFAGVHTDTTIEISLQIIIWQPFFFPLLQIFTHHPY